MNKKLFFAIFALSLLFISIGCASKNKGTEKTPAGATLGEKSNSVPPLENVEITGQAQVDQVGSGISDINNAQNELDDIGLKDVDSGLNDIEKI